MTKIVSDKSTRVTAIPFTAMSYGLNLGISNQEDTVQLVDWTTGIGIASPALRVMRLTKPDRGNLIQAYLNLFMRVGSSLTAKVAIGRFASDGISVVTPTQAEIDAGHLALTGTSTPFASSGSNLFIDGLNLLPKMYRKGDANYNEDGFVLIIQFSRDLTSSDYPTRFEVACSMQMGLI